ncbi:MAG: 2,3-bisphosphoglycerate-independent phosphoglycerate mutase [Thermoleophilia bacterium]
MPSEEPTFVCLLVLDGWGIAPPGPANAVTLADTPNLDRLAADYPRTTLKASGEAVGLPPGQMGNSEVGHLNLGAGRVVYQDLTRINLAIKDGSFFRNTELLKAFEVAREKGGSVHLLGLLSDGGVHSDIAHIEALLEMARQHKQQSLYLHLFLDGRDVSPKSGLAYVAEVEKFLAKAGLGEIATISGRFYAMDRDNRWERIKLAYDAMAHGAGPHNSNPINAVDESYRIDITDEFVIPTVISDKSEARLRDEDSVIFFNFRPDRARELTRSLLSPDFSDFDRGEDPPHPYLVTMTEYDIMFDAPMAFPPETLNNVLAAVLSRENKTQLHIAETEKYAHVTFFFNGGVEQAFPGETRKLIPSPTEVPTYDKKPEMSARKVTDELLDLLDHQHFDFVVVNLANCDMVGHTGIIKAAVEAVEVVDECVGSIVAKVQNRGGICLITSDHGNAERMLDSSNGPDTAHTSELVPLIVTAPVRLASGRALGDVAPTVLDFLNIPVPDDMTGHSIITGL